MSHTIDTIVSSIDTIEEVFSAENRETQDYLELRKEWRSSGFKKILGYAERKKRKEKAAEQNRYVPMFRYLSVGTLSEMIANADKFDELYNGLEDGESRATLDWYIRFRTAYALVGDRAHQVFPSATDMAEYLEADSKLQPDENGLVTIETFHIKTVNTCTIADTWIYDQYRIPGLIEPAKGDTVADIGAYVGETALWFSHKIGDRGRVMAFEAFPGNVPALEANIRLNDVNNIEIIPKGLSDESCSCTMIGSGPLATIERSVDGKGDIELVTLDDYVGKTGVESIDFMKMDIEGAELGALAGARKTIRRFRPKLAISVYHKRDDLVAIPALIRDIVPEYRLLLRHRNPFMSETVLFAKV